MPVLEQTLDEPLFKIVLSRSLIAHNMRDTDEELVIPYDENNPVLFSVLLVRFHLFLL